MDFLNQKKLTKEEWCKMEEPIANQKEQNILNMIQNGFNNPSVQYTPYLCLNSFLNIESKYDSFIYEEVIEPLLLKMNKTNVLQLKDLLRSFQKDKNKQTITKSTQIKMKNSLRLFAKDSYNTQLIEFVLLDEIKKMVKIMQKKTQYKTDKKYGLFLYNIHILYKNYHEHLNKYLKLVVEHIMETFMNDVSILMILKHVSSFIEHNTIFQYQNYTLYEHQKEIFRIFQQKSTHPKFILYCAPTASGKTLSPISLCNEYKVVFVCASKHIGLSLAKNGYYLKKKIGFAFGCNDVQHIRLNYNAINSYKTVNNNKQPDHCDGTKVELMICDLMSFEYAMLYMKSFHSLENIILFWDEPTIGLDTPYHHLHDKIHYIWNINQIPNVVFSCATLPKMENIQNVIHSFQSKFPQSQVEYIESFDQTTNLMIYDEYGNIIMPHTYFEDYQQMVDFLTYQGKKYYKFYNCNECAKFILYYQKHFDSDIVSRSFININDVSMINIKEVYVRILMCIPSTKWSNIFAHYVSLYPLSTTCDDKIGCDLTTKHACSLTNGPSLYVSDKVENICKYLLHITKINPKILTEIHSKIEENTITSVMLSKKRKDYEDKIEKYKDNDKVMEHMRFPADIIELNRQIETLEHKIHSLHLDNQYKPNTRDHYQRWCKDNNYDSCDVCTSHIEDTYIKKIMELYTIHPLYKILLLMGIGVFSNDIMPCDSMTTADAQEENNKYIEYIKHLAEQKSLYLIIANSDYIYGTNYQFSHCYLGKDMKNLSQEKTIQCIGRIGRQEKNKHFSFRFRSKEQIDTLYQIPIESMEANNMNTLFTLNKI